MNINNRTAQDKLAHILAIANGFRLCQDNLLPSVNLITALGIVLLAIKPESKNERQYLQARLYCFSSFDSFNRQLTDLVIEYLQEVEIEQRNNKLSAIEQYLSQAEKILSVTYVYSVFIEDEEKTIETLDRLKSVVELCKIKEFYLDTIESKLYNKAMCNSALLEEIKELLDQTNFERLDTAVLNVANNMLAILEKPFKERQNIETTETAYEYLQQYQRSCKQLDNYCYELHQVMNECYQSNLIPDTFLTEIGNISRQLQSQSFRVAVVGEFSQGKSTLLNALLKDEIQPVRAIPCSGTVTVLKYGEQKRVICRYKDGREEEIPFEQYHKKATISEAAALDSINDELATPEIKEIVFEHPDLELCRHGVEIVDSPGLNEHPERSAITEQLIKDTDAIIFLTNASRLLTQGERELINELKTKINGGNKNAPANNLFIVVNFMDLLRRETDRASVKERIERFAYNNNPVIEGVNRIHFISAQAALDAMLKGHEDEYLNSFNCLTESIETFLTNEIGTIKLQQNVNQLKDLIQTFVNNKTEDKQDLLEQIGVISSWDVELYQLTAMLEEEALNKAVNWWNEWIEKLADIIYYESETWSSTQEDETKIFNFFSHKFHNALMNELNNWVEHRIGYYILKKKFEIIDSETNLIVEALQNLFEEFDSQVGSNIKHEIELSISKQQISLDINIGNINEQEGDGVGFSFGLGGAGLIGAGLLAFTGVGLVPIALTALGSGLGFGALFGESKQDKIKRIVLEKGLEQFYESQQEVFVKISAEITFAFDNKIKSSSQLIDKAISIMEDVIERQDEFAQKTQKVNRINSDIDTLMTQVIK